MVSASHDKTTCIQVHLSFAGNCREAMNFYQHCFDGELNLMTVAESPMHAQWPINAQNLVLHAVLKNKDLILLSSDMGTEKSQISNPVISLALNCASLENLKIYFNKLSQGGKITHPPHQFFDGTIAALCDRYGINWILKH